MHALATSMVAVLALVLVPPTPGPDGSPELRTADEAVRVTGTLTFDGSGYGGSGMLGEAALEWRDVPVGFELTTDDPRLSGELQLVWNCDVFLPDYVRETSGVVVTAAASLENEGGAWQGVWQGLTYPGLAGSQHHLRLSGRGAYEAYSALLYVGLLEGTLVVDGLLFPGELPPLPEVPTA